MAETKWSIRGEYMESCNCDYLCPCVYTNPQGPVTYDHCTAVLVFRIDDGDFGGVRLHRLEIAFVLRVGKVIAHGNLIFAGGGGDAADAPQRTPLAPLSR